VRVDCRNFPRGKGPVTCCRAVRDATYCVLIQLQSGFGRTLGNRGTGVRNRVLEGSRRAAASDLNSDNIFMWI
jgi:hypothetical protein